MTREKPDVEIVRDAYDYCMDAMQDTDASDKQILLAINDEMSSEGYPPFPSLKAVKSYIKSARKD
ncbi:hypothetical protein [Planctobacterium marinum]|uniref:Uncharacterized protein n=1 Tax=Planctobacterium marinum TaxID=1631968 RepID=A0AA48HSG9_9ALTE|nr:hypothetical protein MACH26_26750 [Planctobacterium marinum]